MRTALLTIISETVDLFMDWTFYAKLQQESLTGVSDNTINWIYGFAVWKTVIYICTLICLFVDCCSDEEHENSYTSVLSLLSTVSEDLPQISLAIYVAWSTSHVISWVQIVKALYGVIELCICAGNIFREIDKKLYNPNSDIECIKICDMLLCLLLSFGGVIIFFSHSFQTLHFTLVLFMFLFPFLISEVYLLHINEITKEN